MSRYGPRGQQSTYCLLPTSMEGPPQPTPSPDVPPPPEQHDALRTPDAHEGLQNEMRRVERLSSELVEIDRERAARRWEPYCTLSPRERPYLQPFLMERPPSDQEPTPELVRAAQDKTLALHIEAALQTVEHQAGKTGGVREDMESLQRLGRVLANGERLRAEIASARPNDAEAILRQILIASKRETEEKLTPERLQKYGDVLRRARIRINRAQEALRGYLGR